MPQKYIVSVGVGVGQLIALVLGLDASWAGQGTSLSSMSLPEQTPQYCLTSPSNAAYNEEQGQVSCSRMLGSLLPSLISIGPALLFCPGEVHGLLSQWLLGAYKEGVMWQLSCLHALWAESPAPLPYLLCVVAGEGQG